MLAAGLAISLAAAGDELTVENAVAIAIAGNPRVRAAAAEVDAARGRALQFGARPEPEFTAAIEGISLPGGQRPEEDAEIHLGIEQLFEFPGKRAMRRQIGRCDEEIAKAKLDRVKLVVTAEVKRAYWQAAFAAEAARTLEKSSEWLDLLLGLLQTGYRSGTASYADVLRTRTEKARLRNQVLEQEKERHQAMLELNELLARPAGQPVELLSALSFTPPGVHPEAPAPGDRAYSPSLRIAALRGERAQVAVKLARLGRSPDLLAGFSLPSVRASAWGVALGVSLPFLRPDRVRGLALEAGAGMENARLAAAASERRLRSARESAQAAVRAADEQVRVFERDLLRDLEDELRLQLEYFRFGKGAAYELLDLQRTFVLAEMEHLRAILLYNLARVDLEIAGEELP